MEAPTLLACPWREPHQVLAAFADEPHACALVSGDGGWSYLLREPSATLELGLGDRTEPFAALRHLLGPPRPRHPEGPPFQGGVVALCAYELADRLEPLSLSHLAPWPDLAAGRYEALLAFDGRNRRLVAVGASPQAARRAASWLEEVGTPAQGGRLAASFAAETSGEAYEAVVQTVRQRIAQGEVFQANLARRWGGRLSPGMRPYDVFARMVGQSPAPFSAYLRLPGLAVVSNSPERFVALRDGVAVTQPIKGTRPRDLDPVRDQALADELEGCAKDRAENLMIVDLMRNDLARVCEPGTVTAGPLFELQSFTNVHHLVSTVRGQLLDRCDGFDLMAATFPPGSITGAPKIQAIRMIAQLEGARGPYCGSLVWAGFDGDLDSSVLIRTLGLVETEAGWTFEAGAGAGITAPSDPAAERAETEDKIAALASLLMGEDE